MNMFIQRGFLLSAILFFLSPPPSEKKCVLVTPKDNKSALNYLHSGINIYIF